jgi:hypothetical protein
MLFSHQRRVQQEMSPSKSLSSLRKKREAMRREGKEQKNRKETWRCDDAFSALCWWLFLWYFVKVSIETPFLEDVQRVRVECVLCAT